MNATLLAFTSIGLYGLGAVYEAITSLKSNRSQNALPLLSGIFAASLQILLLITNTSSESIDHFSLVNSAVLITCIAVALFVLFSFKYPIQSMLLFVYPAAMVSIAAFLLSDPAYSDTTFNTGILIHITLSILAYCVLSLAAIQAILVVYRNKYLKQHHKQGWIDRLPPLLVMESILFDLLKAGTALLAAAIIAGFVFIDNLFAQHLAHKTFFSLIAFALYTALLVGREIKGWRGSMAASLTLWATASLMLGFFGTKFVLEAIL
jgi:ABC-type uncharacterized transport system permease subunit